MTLPANIRVNVSAPFPARVAGSGFATIAKANGIYTIGANYRLLANLPSIGDATGKIIAVQDLTTGVFSYMTVAAFLAGSSSNYREVTAAGSVTILTSDVTILLNKTVGAATSIILPLSAARSGVPVTVKDYKGDANTNNITFTLAGTESIDGMLQAAADTAGKSKIDINGDKKTLYPLAAGGWYT